MILSEIAQIHSASKSRQVLTVCSLLKLMEHNILGLWQKPCTCRILWQQSFVEVHQAFTGLICRGSKIPFIIRKLPKFTTLTLHLSIPASVSSCSTVVQSSIYDSNSFVLEMYGFYVQSLNFRSNCYNQSIFFAGKRIIWNLSGTFASERALIQSELLANFPLQSNKSVSSFSTPVNSFIPKSNNPSIFYKRQY